ncbi:MAG: hypothetical protein QNJ40_02525 [Xanthomonadales bacterium]|nr:hypothetical protein [Xanthomonadales bacterium]
MRYLGLLLWVLASPTVHAQVSNAFIYQGVLDQSGSPASGEYDFQFELFDDPDFVAGMSVAGPVTVMDQPVATGNFAVPVDFGMDVFGIVDLWMEVRVREASSSGAFTVLEPRQVLYAVPLAVHALNVAPDVVGGAQIADGTVTAADLAPNTIAAGSVDSSALQLRVSESCAAGSSVRVINSDGSVICETDPGGDITSVNVGTGLTGGADAGDASVSVDFSQVQARLQAQCPAGQLLNGIDASGQPLCQAVPFPATSTVISDPPGPVGSYNTLLIGNDGLPVIVFLSQSPLGVVVVKCNDLACFGADETETLVDVDAGSGGIAAVMRSNGLPLLVYRHGPSDSLRVADCNDPACSGGDEAIHTLVSGLEFGNLSMALDNSGLPVIAFRNGSQLNVIHCNDASCSGGDETSRIAAPSVGFSTGGGSRSVALIGNDGLPLIFIDGTVDFSSGQVRAVKCNDPSCAGQDEEINEVSAFSLSGAQEFTAIIGADGNPLLIRGDDSVSSVELIRCATDDCRFLDPPETVTNTGALALSAILSPNGHPMISFCAGQTMSLVSCNDSICAGSNESVAALDDVCGYSSLALGSDGLPILSYSPGEPAGLYTKVHHCATPICR